MNETGTVSRRFGVNAPWIGVTALYCGLTLIYGWPLIADFGRRLPHDAGDPALNAWILWWNGQAMPLTERWWNAPIFFPAQGAFALSETLLSLVPLTTPLVWAGVGAVPTYNVAFLVSFPAAALAAHALAHRLTGRHDAALLAGLAFGFSPYRAAQMPHLQTLWSCWMPLCLLAFHRYVETQRARYLVLAGLGWWLNGLTSGYFLMFFAILTGCWVLWFARSWRRWAVIVGTLALASAALAPVLIGYVRHQQRLGLSRDAAEIDAFAADLSAVWAASPHLWLSRYWTFAPAPEGELYPGAVVLVLVIVGAVFAWRRAQAVPWRRWRTATALAGAYLAEAALVTAWLGPWRASVGGLTVSLTRPARALVIGIGVLAVAFLTDLRVRAAWRRRSAIAFYAAAAVVMLVLSLGPAGRVFGETFWPAAPYSWLMELPGGRALRVPARFATLFMLCLAQAAALAFASLTPRGSRWPLVAFIALAIVLEGWVARLPTEAAAAPMTLAGANRAAAMLELPSDSLYDDTAAMLRAVGHGLPTVNGFSGYSPPHYVPMQGAIQARDHGVLDAIRRYGPLYVLVNTAKDSSGRWEQFTGQHPLAVLVAQTDVGPLYRLPAGSEPEVLPGGPLTIASVNVSVKPELAWAMTDEDLATRWDTGPQKPGDWLAITLAETARVARIDLDLGRSRTDYPRGLRIEVGRADEPRVAVWEGTTAGLAIAGILANHVRSTVSIPLPETAVGDRLVLTQTGEHSALFWSVAELRVYGSEPNRSP